MKNLSIRCMILFVAAAGLGLRTPAYCEERGRWTLISQSVTAQVKPGYPGKTAGVVVDPASGELYMVVPDQGLWKSTDHGQSFARVDGMVIGGRCETGFALNFDPAGKRLACFMIYGSSGSTSDGGKTWTAFKTSHLDCGAVDWEDSGACYLALRHESGGQLCLSADAGQTWKDLDKGFAAVGLFSVKSLIGSRGQNRGLVRSTDGGTTWQAVSDVTPVGLVMRTFKGVGYWTTVKGLLVSRDQGQTWAIEGAPVSAVLGPYWSQDGKRVVVVGYDGFHESTDAGATWQRVCPLPPDFSVRIIGPNYAWDAKANLFYASSMGKEAFRYDRYQVVKP